MKLNIKFSVFIPFIHFSCLGVVIAKELAFIILSQSSDFHVEIAEKLQKSIIKQYENLKGDLPDVYLSHKDFTHKGAWTIFPILLKIATNNIPNLQWLIFLEDRTGLHLEQLEKLLEKYDFNEETWIGNEMYDQDATIIHHFAFYKDPASFKYPCFASGFAMSSSMLKNLVQRIKNNIDLPDFNIDNSHELALFIWNKGAGQTLVHDSAFCLIDDPDCATFVNSYPKMEIIVSNKEIYFAVKTWEQYHNERLSVIEKTWGKKAVNIKYFSNVQDISFGTVSIGIPNTERGHCAKTLAILRYIVENDKNASVKWVAVVDDDTILSLPRLQQLISRYNHTQDVAIGERYGFNVARSPAQGYNYITGGGGMILSMPLVRKTVKKCKCPTPDSPDDMILGAFLTTENIEITHSSAFHQARPVDYSPKYLQTEEPVSFHKHWMIDPIKIYDQWFSQVDTDDNVHNEL